MAAAVVARAAERRGGRVASSGRVSGTGRGGGMHEGLDQQELLF